MRAVITGISGFVGSHLALHLLEVGDRLLGVSCRGQWHEDAPSRLREEVNLLAWDLPGDIPGATRAAVEAFRPDCIYHFAGISIPARCGTDEPTHESIRVNVEGARAVLDLAASMPWRPRFILASSNHVYAPVTAAKPMVDECWPMVPRSAYGKTQVFAEQATIAAIRNQAVDAVLVRGFQHAGPRQPLGLMLADWVAQLSGTMPGRLVVKSLDSFLDVVDVRDAARAYRTLAQKGQTGEAYNLGSGQMQRSGDVLELLFSIAGCRPHVEESAPGEQWNPIASISKLRDLSWRPLISLQTTISDMLRP